jgi:TolA-binding protein
MKAGQPYNTDIDTLTAALWVARDLSIQVHGTVPTEVADGPTALTHLVDRMHMLERMEAKEYQHANRLMDKLKQAEQELDDLRQHELQALEAAGRTQAKLDARIRELEAQASKYQDTIMRLSKDGEA